jgi:hypothetical protein
MHGFMNVKFRIKHSAFATLIQLISILTDFRGEIDDKSKVCNYHHTIQINQPTRCNNFSGLLPDVYVQINMFRASSHPSTGAQQLH